MPDVKQTVSVDVGNIQELDALIARAKELQSVYDAINRVSARAPLSRPMNEMITNAARREVIGGKPGPALQAFQEEFQATFEYARAQASPAIARLYKRQVYRGFLGDANDPQEMKQREADEDAAQAINTNRDEQTFRRRARVTGSLDRQRLRETAKEEREEDQDFSKRARVTSRLDRQRIQEHDRAETEGYRESELRDKQVEDEKSDAYRQIQVRSRNRQAVASRIRRGIDPYQDEAVRAQVSKMIGSEDEGAITSEIGTLQAEAQMSGLLKARGRFGRFGAFAGAVAASGIAAKADTLATSYIEASSAGKPFYSEQHTAEVAGMGGGAYAGILAFALTRNPLVTAIAAGAGAEVSSRIGGLFDTANKGKMELNDVLRNASIATGIRASRMQEIAYGLRGPLNLTQEMVKATTELDVASRLGGGQIDIPSTGSYAQRAGKISLPQDESEALRSLRMRFRENTSEAVKAMAPILADPLYRETYLKGATNPGSLNPSDVIGALQSHSPSEVFNALGPTRRGDLQNIIGQYVSFTRQNELSQRGFAAQTGIDTSELSRLSATGISMQSPQIATAYQAVIQDLARQRKGIEEYINNLEKSGKPYGEIAVAITEAKGKIAAFNAAIQQATQAHLLTASQERAGDFATAVTRAGYRAQVELTGARAGVVPDSVFNEIKAIRSNAANALRDANDMALPRDYRQRRRTEAEQAPVAIQQMLRVIDDIQSGMPTRIASSYAARNRAYTEYARTTGESEQNIGRRLDVDISLQRESYRREQQRLRDMQTKRDTQGNRLYNDEELEAQGARVTQADLTLRNSIRERVLQPSNEALRLATYASNIAQPTAAYAQLLNKSPQDVLAANLQVINAMKQEQAALREQAKAILKENPLATTAAGNLTNQANAMQPVIQTQTLQALMTYSPSAKDQLRLGQTGLAIDLARGDVSYGGQVPTELHQQMLQSLLGQVNQIDKRVAAVPEGPEREAVAASTFQQRANLLLGAQQERNAMQYGDMGRMMNLMVGAPGDFTFAMPTIAESQRMNPGGTKALGGTGESIGLSDIQYLALNAGDTSQTMPSVGTPGSGLSDAPQTLGQALGGTGGQATQETNLILREILRAIQEGRLTITPPRMNAGGASPAQQTNTDPYQAASGMQR